MQIENDSGSNKNVVKNNPWGSKKGHGAFFCAERRAGIVCLFLIKEDQPATWVWSDKLIIMKQSSCQRFLINKLIRIQKFPKLSKTYNKCLVRLGRILHVHNKCTVQHFMYIDVIVPSSPWGQKLKHLSLVHSAHMRYIRKNKQNCNRTLTFVHIKNEMGSP
jgi:hypothetical protein